MRRLFLSLMTLVLCLGASAQETPDTLSAARVSSVRGSVVAPQVITSKELRSVSALPEAVRRFAGVQLRDYGGVGGLRTVNVRSLGSEHTGVFVDGIQVDNAQNMQVDLGRFGLEGLGAVSLFSGQKSSPLQSAKEYSSASSLYLESSEPVFRPGKRDNWIIGSSVGSFGTFSPRAVWEHAFKGGTSLRLTGEGVSSTGRYRFHVKDYRQYPDGSIAGYDTTMTRQNCDLAGVRAEARLSSPRSSGSFWNIHAYFYGSGRGLPGPVYKKAGEYPLSLDRQTDRDAFIQGRYVREICKGWSMALRTKLSFSHLEYTDFPELAPEDSPARYNYRNHSAYLSAAASRTAGKFRLNVAQDLQYDYLDADLRGFVFPGRLSSWSCVSAAFLTGPLDVSANLLYLIERDSFLSGDDRSSSSRDALMPSLVFSWKPSGRLSVNGFAKRSFRMPTFNDLYYTTVGSKTLDPEDAFQLDLGAEWRAVESISHHLALKVDVYRNLLRNKIIAVPTSNQFRWSMYNLGKVSVLGGDLTADYSFRFDDGEAGLVARYTLQRSRDRSDPEALTWNGQIPYIPLHSGSVNLFGSFSGWRADMTFFATGERFTTSANLPAYRLAPWTTLDAALSKDISLKTGSLSLKLRLNNLLNEQYAIVDNYPMPGFNFLFGITFAF